MSRYLTLRGRGFEPGASRNGQVEAEGTTAGWWDGAGAHGTTGNNRRANGVAPVSYTAVFHWVPWFPNFNTGRFPMFQLLRCSFCLLILSHTDQLHSLEDVALSFMVVFI
jgi:hypothetical protein